MIYRGPDFLAVIWCGSSPPPPPRDTLLTGEGGRGWARSQIIRPQEILVLYRSFNTLWGERACTRFTESRKITKEGYEETMNVVLSTWERTGKEPKNKTTGRKLWASSYIFHSRVKRLSAIPWCEDKAKWAQLCTCTPNKLWRLNSTFNLCVGGIGVTPPAPTHFYGRLIWKDINRRREQFPASSDISFMEYKTVLTPHNFTPFITC